MAYIPDQGDIIWLNFDPSSGNEIIKKRPAFVISRRLFNENVGMAIVAPVTSTLRGSKLEIVLSETTKIQGAIRISQLKSLNFKARKIKFIEKAPADLIKDVCAIAQVIVS